MFFWHMCKKYDVFNKKQRVFALFNVIMAVNVCGMRADCLQR